MASVTLMFMSDPILIARQTVWALVDPRQTVWALVDDHSSRIDTRGCLIYRYAVFFLPLCAW